MSVDEVDATTRSPEAKRAERQDEAPAPGEAKPDSAKAAPGDSGKAAVASAREEARKKRRPTVFIIGVVVIALLVIGGIYYWLTTRNIEETDDAYTDGRAITIAPRISGAVISLDVDDNQFVKQGQPLIHIDPRQYQIDREQAEGALATAQAQYRGQQFGLEVAKKNFPAQLEVAKAQLEQAQATRARTKADYERQKALPKAATSQQDVDAAEAALKQAEAQIALAEAQVRQNSPVPERIGETDAAVGQLKGQVEQAQARLDQANLNLSWTQVAAPQDGWVTKRNVETGNYVAPGQQIFSIVAPEIWITANFKESQLVNMRPGQRVEIRVDAYPHLRLEGHVDSIQLGSGSKFTAFPPENATGNFIKIVQRVPVKIVIDKGLDPKVPLPLGISAVPTVTVR
ncbi:HlyD family secretion protein [Bradyrhizobium erythrophlei]|jgi:membrane fusion protein (multidrug efflux system)|uniref:Membrane fusion protein, multidrug efflux system n=1 Tax=Bradyrhizobium erythrophlei TaxID=1437360 RepID=A0A1M7UET5_9BRAD|nr:HlyD family secretion protein [Bradyrhizobium erythrophlei]SHN81390.1 membrane fusion protein, multidrug efflux system [Bradyrhizobium erythrophlei]